MYRNLIWDLDGTLFDTYPAIAGVYQAALRVLGREASLAWLEGLARRSLSYCVATVAETYRLDGASIEQAFKTHYGLVTPKQQPPLPGVIDLCRYICSIKGRNVIVTHRERASSMELLTAHHMAGYFAGCITRDDGYPRKPDPAAMNAALTLFRLERGETLAIGDREIDVAAGKAVGLATCLYGAAEEGTAADYHVGSYTKLYPYLTRE